jgi:YidC/Oxa1 family membrane protein insertase
MAKIQPRLAELRRRYKDNPERLTAETRALFKEHRISPLAGCLASVLQLPVFMTMFQVVRGLAHRQAGSATFRPRYLGHGSRLYKALIAGHTMRSWGVDLAQTGIAALHTTPMSAIIVCLLVTITVVAGLVQQRIAAKPTRQVPGPRGDDTHDSGAGRVDHRSALRPLRTVVASRRRHLLRGRHCPSPRTTVGVHPYPPLHLTGPHITQGDIGDGSKDEREGVDLYSAKHLSRRNSAPALCVAALCPRPYNCC